MIGRGLLVSVRDADEATEALAGGAAIVDVKEPRAGPLGAAPASTAAAIARRVGGAVPWTLAGGELLDARGGAADGVDRLRRHVDDVLAGLDVAPAPAAVKVGLSGAIDAGWRTALGRLAAGLPPGIGLVAVAYADWRGCQAPDPEAILAAALHAGWGGFLVDTFDKSGPGLFGCLDHATVGRWGGLCRSAGSPLALAGKLTLDEVTLAASLGADIAGVRSVVCVSAGPGREAGDRLGMVRRDRVRAAVERFDASVGPAAG